MEKEEIKAENLEQYRPIKGGLRMAMVAIATIGMWLLVVALPFMVALIVVPPHGSVTIAGAVAVTLFSIIFWRLMWTAVWEILRKYWRRNVIGYRVAFWRKDGQQHYEAYLRGHSMALCQRLKVEPDVGPMVVLALGGWFNSSCFCQSFVYFFSGENGTADDRRKSDWRVRLVKDEKIGWARFDDGYGNALIMPAEEFLETATALLSRGERGMDRSWLNIIRLFVSEKDNYKNSWQAAAEERDRRGVEIEELRSARDKERSERVRIITVAIGDLDETTRFIHSKEARLIRRWLVSELNTALPPGDPRRQQFGLKVKD